MTLRKFFPTIYRMADDGTGATLAPEPTPSPTPPTESVLFPNDTKQPDATPAPTPDPSKPAEWKDYVADPAKSEAENAAAKVEHDKAKPATPDLADKVPDDGKYALNMPDGMKVDQELLDALSPDFKAMGLTMKQAQTLADKFVAAQQKQAEQKGEAWAGTVAKWADDAKADKEIGGANWDKTVSSATRAMKAFGSPELKNYLEATGGGNHPEVIRAFARAGAMIREDDPATGGAGGSGKPAEAAHVLFPNDAPKG